MVNLTWEDLISLSEVNTLCYKACKIDSLWYRECMRLFVGPLEYFGFKDVEKQERSLKPGQLATWRERFMASMSSYRAWTGLSKAGILSVTDLNFLRDDIFETLRDPVLPAPALRRETRCFATTIQDLIGNELYFKEEQMGFDFPEEAEEILRVLDDHSLKILEEFSE